MIGTGSAEFSQARPINAVDEAQHLLVILHCSDETLVYRDLPAQPGDEPGDHPPSLIRCR